MARTTRTDIVSTIYATQRFNSKKRNHEMPNYTNLELRVWIFKQDNFEELYINWVESGFETRLKPSCDRNRDDLPYTLSNLTLMTWGENNKKAHKDRKKGILITSQHKKVIGVNIKTGKVVNFHSANQASRELGVNRGNICNCCRGEVKSAGGYNWGYVD